MLGQLAALAKEASKNIRDFLPILAVIAIFQWLVVDEPMPDLGERIAGIVLTMLGLTFFVRGLSMSMFPLGESLAYGLARRGSVAILIAFGFALGFGSTVAEPALASVADQVVAAAASTGSVSGSEKELAALGLLLRYVVSAAVGLAVAAGVLRVVKGWPITWFVLPGYAIATLIAVVGDSPLSVVAFDAGAAATSAINVPLMMTLGTGLATMIAGRSPLADGFGLVAVASLMPMLALLVVGLFLG